MNRAVYRKEAKVKIRLMEKQWAHPEARGTAPPLTAAQPKRTMPVGTPMRTVLFRSLVVTLYVSPTILAGAALSAAAAAVTPLDT